MIDAPKGMSCCSVEEEEKAPKSRFIPLSRTWLWGFQAEMGRMKWAEYSSSSGFGDGPGSLNNERPKWQRFLDEMGEAVDRRVRGEMLR